MSEDDAFASGEKHLQDACDIFVPIDGEDDDARSVGKVSVEGFQECLDRSDVMGGVENNRWRFAHHFDAGGAGGVR